MNLNKKICAGIFLLFVIFFLSFISAYPRSQVEWSVQPPKTSTIVDQSVCQSGQDFLIQISPFGCTPAVIRSDLLEENDVPVYCSLGATKINPLIDVEAIDSISFSGKYPKEVSGLGFHPAKAALGVKGQLNSPVLENIGYVVINVKQQANVSAIPDYVSGTLTAKIKYNINNAFGIGKALFYLPELNDKDWEARKNSYSFWGGKGYLRAENIDADEADISLYSNEQRISSVNLKKGDTSDSISLPGFNCQAGLKLKLEDLENPDTRAQLRVNADIIEVGLNERFLDNKCQVKDLKKNGITQTVKIKCKEDDETNDFSLIISPKITLNINGENKEVGIGDFLYSDGDKSIYVGYIGTNGNTNSLDDLFIVLVSIPNSISSKKDKLSDDEISSINSMFKGVYSIPVGIIDKTSNILESLGGASNILLRAIVSGETFYKLNFETKTQNIFGQTISIIGFSGVQDSELTGDAKEDYEKAKEDYETIRNQFSSEQYTKDASSTFGEEALYSEILLAWDANQKKTVSELCKEFVQDYPNSNKNIVDYCRNDYQLSNKEVENVYVTVNKKIKKISFDGIYEPTWDDYGAKVVIGTPEGAISFDLRKNAVENLYSSGTDYIKLISLEDNSAVVEISITTSEGAKYGTVKLEKDVMKDFEKDYSLTLTKINLKKLAKISVTPKIDDAGTQANFSFKIGIEKRAIVLPPEKIKKMIGELNKEIDKWQGMSDSLGKAVEGLKTACLVAGAALTVKNFAANVRGTGIARQEVMSGKNGWKEKCADLVSKGTYSSQEECYSKNSDKIDKDVNELSKLIEQQNSQIKKLEQGITTKEFLSEQIVDTDKFMEDYIPKVNEFLQQNLPDTIEDPKRLGETINKEDISHLLTYENWKNKRIYSKEQLREIELYTNVINDKSASDELRNIANAKLYSDLVDIKTNSKDSEKISNWASDLKVSSNKISSLETQGNVKRLKYEGLKNGDIGNKISGAGIDTDTPVALIQTFPDGKKYIIALDGSGGTSQLNIKDLGIPPATQLAIYDSSGMIVPTPPAELTNVYFEKFDASSYKNQYKKAKLTYYETEPYKGLPAVVPFDLTDGWYAATKQTLPVGGNIQSYQTSGRVSSFYLCNVGENGMEEFQTIGDDICEMINTGTGQAYNQFSGLEESEAKKLITNAVSAIEQASKMYQSGLSGKVKILGESVEVGSPAVDVPQFECQDFMSPKDCKLLFNLCDPVICPSSRCDLGGAYPVKDVVQSGIIGSIVLCLPNAKEGIIMPICLTGIKAGIDGFLSVKKSYRDCLNESLATGKMVGICDEVYSLYICDFFWRQALPLANMVIPKVVESLMGQNVRGGGEYLGVANAWDTAQKSVSYFTQSYGVNSMASFKARTTEEIGGEICKLYTSAVYPSGGDLLSKLTQPDSPPQFHGRFDEIPLTTATVPPTSHYKVFYHIFAGKDSGAYYQVYLKGSIESSYYQDTAQSMMVASGYVTVGSYASETKDFTATSGYKELCINVNGQEECGFEQVSTDFALNYIKDEYLKSQATQTDITKESECISGSASAYSLLNLNIQSAAQEMIDPALYNKGVIRVCATDNPGKGTDAYAGTENSRWKEVGYCDNEKVKCWLDTESVKDVIKTTTVEGETLNEVSENYLEILKNESGYLSNEEFSSFISEIEKETDSANKIILIDKIFEKVFWSGEKVQLFYLRGNAYADLFRALWSKIKSGETTTETPEGETTKISSEGGDASMKVLTAIEDLEGKSAETNIIAKEMGIPEDKVSCWSSVTYVYKKAGVNVGHCIYSDAKGKKYSVPWSDGKSYSVEMGISKREGEKDVSFMVYPKPNCALVGGSIQQKYDNIKPGDLLSIVADPRIGGWGHNVIFVEWVDKSKGIAKLFGWRRDEQNKLVFKTYDADIGETGTNPVYVYWEPSVTKTTREIQTQIEQQISSSPFIPIQTEEMSFSGKIYQEAFKLEGSQIDTTKFVIDSLNKAGVNEIADTPFVDSLDTKLNLNKDFAEVNVNNLKVGDIIFLGKKCKKSYSVGIFYYLSGNKISFYANLGGTKVENVKSNFISEISDSLYVYRAYRYVGDLTDAEKGSITVRTRWILDTAITKVNELLKIPGKTNGGKYSDNKPFVDQLIFDGILTEQECKDVRGFFGLGQKDMNWLKKLLLKKIGGESGEVQDTTETTFSTAKLDKIINGEMALAPVSCQGQALCAQYSRELAEELFEYKYFQTSVWCREAIGDKLIWKTPSLEKVYQMSSLTTIREENKNKLIELESEGTLKPGMILGVYYPATLSGIVYGKETECTGFYSKPGVLITVKPYYTHNLLYLGKNKNKEMVFAEFFHSSPSTRTLNQFEKDGFVVMAVFAPPSRLN